MAIQIDLLKDVIAGSRQSLTRSQTLNLLRSENVLDNVQGYQMLLEDEQESSKTRSLAATSLSRVNLPDSIEILTRNLRTIKDPQVLVSSVKGLGRIGDVNSLEAITQVRSTATGLLAFQADFATSLISHRLRLPGNDLRVPQPQEYLALEAEVARSFEVFAPPDEESERCLRSLATQPFAVEYARESLAQIQCGRNTWMLLLNQEFAAADAPQKLLAEKAFPGVLALRSEENLTYSTALLLLTAPTQNTNELNLLVHRSSGEQMFSGTATVEDNAMKFSLRSISQPGAYAIEVEGRFVDGRVDFQNTLSGTMIVARRQPTKATL